MKSFTIAVFALICVGIVLGASRPADASCSTLLPLGLAPSADCFKLQAKPGYRPRQKQFHCLPNCLLWLEIQLHYLQTNANFLKHVRRAAKSECEEHRDRENRPSNKVPGKRGEVFV